MVRHGAVINIFGAKMGLTACTAPAQINTVSTAAMHTPLPKWVETSTEARPVVRPVMSGMPLTATAELFCFRETTLWAITEREQSLQSSYSITSSAMACSFAGNSIPSALAVLRLRTSCNFVGRCTGKSAGVAPFNICPT